MAEYTLTIRTDNETELKNILAQITSSGATISAGDGSAEDSSGTSGPVSAWTPERFDYFWRRLSGKCKRIFVDVAEHPDKAWPSTVAQRTGIAINALGGVLSSNGHGMNALWKRYGREIPRALEYNRETSMYYVRPELVEWVLRAGEGMKG